MKYLFTVIIDFSDHLKGVQQIEAETPLEAIQISLRTSEAYEGYDRELLVKSILRLIHYAEVKGIWGIVFNPEADLSGEEDNPILGGYAIQTDSKAPTRPKG